jgi:hypothetical protein
MSACLCKEIIDPTMGMVGIKVHKDCPHHSGKFDIVKRVKTQRASKLTVPLESDITSPNYGRPIPHERGRFELDDVAGFEYIADKRKK